MRSATERVRRGLHRRARREPPDRSPPDPPPAPPPTAPGPEPPRLPKQPLLSVVVPIYQVEDYLAQCLDSLLVQTYENLEILVVDDGSTDRSAEIARAYAVRDPRITVVRQRNAGLGAARNTGVQLSTGDLLTFADSDDTVPPGAYQRMVGTLRRSNSDFVVGALVRDEGGVELMRPWARRAHAQRRLAVTIDDAPELLNNVVACTKVFRRDFVDRIGLRFPEGTRYEDQVPVTQAYLLARSFDVLPDVVYRWRKRDDKSSISQQKAELPDLVDRLAAQRASADFLHEHASDVVLRTWYVKTFRQDFFAYLRVAADADDGYWEHLQDSIVSIARQAPDDLEDQVELRIRLAVWLGRHGLREALRALVRDEGFPSSNFPVAALDGGGLVARVPALERLGVPVDQHLLRVRDVDLRLLTRLEGLDWSVGGVLSVRCLAALAFVDPTRHPVETTLLLTGPAGTSYGGVPARPAPDEIGNIAARRSHEDHAASVVVADLDLAALVRAGGDRPLVRWEVRLRTATGPMAAEAPLESRREDGSAVAGRSVLVDGAVVTTRWAERQGLVVEIRRGCAAVTEVTADDGAFRLTVHAPGLAAIGEVHVGPHPVPASVVATGPERWSVRLAPARPDGGQLAGRVRIAGHPGDQQPLPVVGDLEPGAACVGGVAMVISSDGLLTASADRPVLLVDDVEVREHSVLLTGRAHDVTGGRGRLSGPRAVTDAGDVHVERGRFELEIPLWHAPWGDEPVPVPVNVYSVTVRDGTTPVRVLAGRLHGLALPASPVRGWSVQVGADRRLLLRRSRHADRRVASRHGQRVLRSTVYDVALSRPPRDLVLLESFGGTGTGDGPRAICDRLLEAGTDLDLVWSTSDLAVPRVDGTRTVLRGSPEWYDAMGSARLLVNNNTFPPYTRKGPEQCYVQTWHGTPLKRIGTDIPHQRLSTEHYLRLLLREVNTWDLLVSPSAYCTEIFRRAFAFDGEILEIGRPSNDLLLSASAGKLRESVRADLRVAEDQTVLLYAPTWRDDASRGGTWDKALFLDARRVTAARPDVTVLVRGHANTASRPRVTGVDRVLDVTAYPDIARLYLAADLLVTDYSGAMFDFAVTDKPMVLLTPDLEPYRDRVRGLYLDLEALAPGPVVRSTDALLERLDEDWSAARARLRATYAPHDDGAVTDRLLTALGLGGGLPRA